jgi:hypothetical protein
MWYDYENKSNFFIVNAILLLFATGLGFVETPSGFGIGWMTIGTTNIVG